MLAALWLGCGAKPPPEVPPSPLAAEQLAPVTTPHDDLSADGPVALDAGLLEQLPEGTFGPYLGAAPDGRAVALWAPLAEGGTRSWFSVALDAKGAALAAPRKLLDAPDDLSLAKVEASGDGFVVLVTRSSAEGTRVEALTLDASAALVSGPTLLDQTANEVVWIDALAVGQSRLGLWASVSGGLAQVYLTRFDASGGRSAGMPSRVLDGVRAWQAVTFSDGVALAAVLAGAKPNTEVLRVLFLDPDGRTLGQTDLVTGKRLEAEIDAVRVGDRLVVAWVQQDGMEQRLSLAALGTDMRRVAGPEQPALLGSQRLFGFVPTLERSADGLLIWEDLGQAPRGQRRYVIGRVTPEARLKGRRAELSFLGDARDRPEFARKGGALAALTRGAACQRGQAGCMGPESAPLYVELGPELDPLAAEPMRLAPARGQFADLAWGLHCTTDSCAALGALPSTPVPVYGVELRARSHEWISPAVSLPSQGPRSVEMRAVTLTEPLADVASASTGENWLVASLTQFDESTPLVKRTTPAPDGRFAPLRALLEVRTLARGKSELGAAQTISYRARAPGGISLAGADGRALLLWTALDKGRPEVFATLLGRQGQPTAQRMLTQAAGQVSEVAGAVLPQGFVASWIAAPKGDAQVFAARLGADLAPAAPLQLSQSPGVALAVAVARRGNGAWLAWVHGGDHEQRLSLSRLDPQTGKRSGEDRVLVRTQSGTLASPALVARADGALLAWIEHPVVGSGGGRAWVVELDAEGKPRGEPRGIASHAGDALAVQVACDSQRCTGSLDCRPPSGPLLEGFVWPSATPAAGPAAAGAAAAAGPGAAAAELSSQLLVRRASAASDTPAFALAGGQLFYGDRRGERGLLRRVGIEWE